MRMVFEFFTDYGYVFEMMFAIGFFTWWMEKRKYYALRTVFVGIVLLAVMRVTQVLPLPGVFTQSVRVVLIYILCMAGVLFCYRVDAICAVFHVTAAGAVQHCSFKLARTVLMPLWAFGTMSDIRVLMLDWGYPVLFILFVAAAYLIFGRVFRREDTDHLTSTPLILFLLIGMQLCTNIFQNVLENFEVGLEVYTIFNLFDMIYCLFLLALQCEFAKKENEQRNNAVLKQMLHQQKEQMKISKENIELINIKCHDIKNQIAMLGSRIPKDEVEELERAVEIYDTDQKTGNEALDVLLMEKQMQCRNRGICLDCVIRGESLSFMRQADVYALFGNAIDNAIEAVDKLSDENYRHIRVKVREDKGMLVIHFENNYSGMLDFQEGLPKTTKQDKRYHGFGMKSIRMITDKYKGYMSVKADDGLFTLNIILPAGK